MANNYVQAGATLTLAPGANVDSGDGYLFGDGLFGIAVTDVDNGKPGEFATEGVWRLPKTSDLDISTGDLLYWDAANKRLNKTTLNNKCVGVAVADAANPSSTVLVKLGVHVGAGTTG